LSQVNKFSVKELYRDRYARTGEASNQLKRILIPASGIGIRTKQDLLTLIKLRMDHPTEHLGFCITQLAYSENTLIHLNKNLEEEKRKFKFTALGEQLKMFSEKTVLASEPSTEFTYWTHKKILAKIQKSLDAPKFLKNYALQVLKKKNDASLDEEGFQKWKERFFEKSWKQVVSDTDLLDDLALENHKAQLSCKADILIPPTPPVVSPSSLDLALRVIDHTGSIWGDSTAAYLVIKQSIIKDKDLRSKILDFYKKTKLPILMLKIKDFETTDPDKIDLRNAFNEIQETFCSIRKNNTKKCTILLDGGKLTYPSLVRGFDIVTNNVSGKNKLGGGRRKVGEVIDNHSPYYVNSKKILYQYHMIKELSKNELKITKNEHALPCNLPCCKNVKTLDGMTPNFWNFSIVRPHFALTMNEDAKKVSDFIYKNNIQDAKNNLLKSELCVLKHLIPDV